ncbi:MAG: hypothetical protein AAFW87_13765 [Pseudomonadota bacterium]
MIIFDICLGRFSILAQREPYHRSFKVTREGPGEIVINLPSTSVLFTNYRRATKHSQ